MQERASSARYRAKDPHKVRAAVRESKESKREIIRAAKNKPCADCGGQYPYYIMDLDHGVGDKIINVGLMVGWGYTSAEIITEISKCDVICSNCHRERTFKRTVAKRRIGPGGSAMPPPDSEDWGLPEGAPDDAVDDDPNDSEVPSIHRQEQVPFGRSATR
jgi:hypothetical protein